MKIAVSIVEDDSQVRSILVGWVNDSPGFRLAGDWGNAEHALDLLPEIKPDVVLMDINLPGMSGVEAVRKLKPALSKTQFVMLTVYDDADNIYKALAAGATGYLLKQTPLEELLGAIEDVHLGGSPMSSIIARKVIQSFKQVTIPIPECEELSPREREVLDLVARGCFLKEVAARLNISMGTVKTYLRRIYEKLHVRSRTQAVAKYANLKPISTH